MFVLSSIKNTFECVLYYRTTTSACIWQNFSFYPKNVRVFDDNSMEIDLTV